VRDSSGNPFVPAFGAKDWECIARPLWSRPNDKLKLFLLQCFASSRLCEQKKYLSQRHEEAKFKKAIGLDIKKQNSGYPSLLANRPEFCFERKKQNSGNQPEFQSSIKKRTVNQTVVTFMSRR
jgi:hypothetical protein